MHRLKTWLVYRWENTFQYLLVSHLLKNSITPHQNKVVTIDDFKATDFWCRNNDICFSAIPRIFGLDVPYRPWNRKSSRIYSVRPSQSLCARRVSGRGIRYKAEILINFSSVLFNPGCFIWIFWLMIPTQCHEALTAVQAHNCSTISGVCYISNISDNKNDYCATTTALNFSANTLKVGIF